MDKHGAWLACGGIAAGIAGIGLAADRRLQTAPALTLAGGLAGSAYLVGTFNQVTGAIEATGQVVAGTDVFAHATGTLIFIGVEDLATGSFTNTITGTVCLAHD